MADGKTDSDGRFELKGSASELTTIDPILKVYHDCDDGIMVFYQIFNEKKFKF